VQLLVALRVCHHHHNTTAAPNAPVQLLRDVTPRAGEILHDVQPADSCAEYMPPVLTCLTLHRQRSVALS
jgi:hypothetical protein